MLDALFTEPRHCRTAPGVIAVSAPIFDLDALFAPGFQIPCGPGQATMRVSEIGELALPTGQVAVTAAPAKPDPRIFAEPVAPGQHRVQVARAEFSGLTDWPEALIAAMKLLVSDDPIVAWQPSAFDRIIPGEPIGAYRVDGGAGCLGSPEVFAAIATDARRHRAVADATARVAPAGATVCSVPEIGAGLAIAAAGWGNGNYTTWAGYAANGAIAALVTDFDIFGAEESAG
jgi:hypothetical protein